MRYKVISCGQSSHNILYNNQLMNKNSFMVICSRELADDIARIMEAALNESGAPAVQQATAQSTPLSPTEANGVYECRVCGHSDLRFK